MKKILSIVAAVLFSFSYSGDLYAQVMSDTFDSNENGWSEIVNKKKGTALVIDGVLHMESKEGVQVISSCYAPFDYEKPFVLKVEALAKKIDDVRFFGILLDCEDDNNNILFYLCEGEARLRVTKEGQIVGEKSERLNLDSGKKVGISFEVEYNLTELIFRVNGVKATSYRRRVSKGEFLLGTSGIGFYACNGQVIDWDNLTVEQ